jgi:tRNA pseudouridine55 synthase
MLRSGLLLIDKPEGPSSASIVHKAKIILGAKKVGHLGTLDPFASGLLVLGVNDGTKIADIFLRAAKSYRGVMTLGVQTDSQDATGNVIDVRDVPPVSEEDLRALERQFSGDLEQTPPMFSALKKDGMRLYKLARQGREVPREPRAIRIDALQLRRIDSTELELDVTCSRGTYVRTLAADMGNALGCGAHLKTLRRLSCGHLSLSQAVSMEYLNDSAASKEDLLISLATALSPLRAVSWEQGRLSRLRLGQQQILRQIGTPCADAELVRITDLRGDLVALARWTEDPGGGTWRLLRVFSD